MLAKNDTLPSIDNTYIFYIYAQDYGSNLASGPNSTIPIENNNSEFSTRMMIEDGNVLDEVREGVANQVVTERKRAVSNDDASINN